MCPCRRSVFHFCVRKSRRRRIACSAHYLCCAILAAKKGVDKRLSSGSRKKGEKVEKKSVYMVIDWCQANRFHLEKKKT